MTMVGLPSTCTALEVLDQARRVFGDELNNLPRLPVLAAESAADLESVTERLQTIASKLTGGG